MMAMATGTGKTVTSIRGVADLRASLEAPLAIVVLAPYIHLVDQWAAELQRWSVKPIRCYGSSASWTGLVQERIDLFHAGAIDVLCLVGTHSSAALQPMQEAFSRLPSAQSVLIADEAHHLGSDLGLDALPQHFRYRLGLSATPERWEDPTGTQRLLDYFGGVIFEFGIMAAIEAGCLCPYDYFPEIVDLNPDELDEYHRVTSLLVTELAKRPERRAQKRLQQLMLERSAVLDSAAGKLERLREAVDADRPDRSLVYCANRKQLSAVMDLLWDRAIASRQFTGEEDSETRRTTLQQFENTVVPALVAMKCLDEGVDVPVAREAYLLASSGNPKQFVQRRGRLLRNAPGKSHAVIHDYVVVPDARNEAELEILRREMRRVVEFANAASNRSQALDVIWPALSRNGLLHEVGADGRS
jgi:superfamily II DNA or RNA helicase